MTLPSLLQTWYLTNQRALPFRLNKDPYRVWISEIMAQQTQIDTMIPYYLRWMDKWPTLESLSQAKEEDVLKLWEGLGYYSRARNILKAAKILSENGQGFPKTLEEIRALPGIGAYTAAAIASICFEIPAVAVDGNVVRVVSRLFELTDELGSPALTKKVTAEMTGWMAEATPSVFTQAMMELGALVCTPKNPECDHCPLKDFCQSRQIKTMTHYPVKKAAKAKPVLAKNILIVTSSDGRIAVTQAAKDALMKGYWRFPEVESVPEGAVNLGHFRHVFTHLIWELDFYSLSQEKTPQWRWLNETELDEIPLITAHRVFYQSVKTRIFSSEV